MRRGFGVAVLLMCLMAQPASAIYKCVAADGKLSFQDQPCPNGQRQSRVAADSDPDARAADSPTLWTLTSGNKTITIGLPSDWQASIRQQGAAATLRASFNSDERHLLLLTVLPRSTRRQSNAKTLAELMHAISDDNAGEPQGRLLQKLPFTPVLMPNAIGEALLFKDDAVDAATVGNTHNYAFAIVGGMVTDTSLSHFTLLTNDPEADDLKRVLASLQMMMERAVD